MTDLLDVPVLKTAAMVIGGVFCMMLLLMHSFLSDMGSEGSLIDPSIDHRRIRQLLREKYNQWDPSSSGKQEKESMEEILTKLRLKQREEETSRGYSGANMMDIVRGQNQQAAQILREYEEKYPRDNLQRARDFVETRLRHPRPYQTQSDVPYDIYNCPEEPPEDYPFTWNIITVLDNWNPGNTTEPSFIHQGLCRFDYGKDLEKAERYRSLELPFMIYGEPDLLRTSERWNRDPTYLHKLLGKRKEKNEHAFHKHFMYWKVRHVQKLPRNWKAPTDEVQMSYPDWLEKAKTVQDDKSDHERWYFRVNGVPNDNHGFLYQEFPMFLPDKQRFMIVDPKEQRGINCRFGMKGIIAEAHYDQGRNFVVLMGGQRRYILAHPRECTNMCLYDFHHPSGRHSAVDWTQPDLENFPQFGEAQVNEVVLQAGDALYLPTYWFHFIISLNVNYQCNARSGTTFDYQEFVQDRCTMLDS